MKDIEYRAMGWTRDIPDFRDFAPESPDVNQTLKASKPLKAALKKRPPKADLRQWCSPIEDQGDLNSCTANAGVGLLEYFERRAFGAYLDASRLFLYKATRNLLGWTGDRGAYLRTTMKAMALFGVPPSQVQPYDVEHFDQEPPAFCYAYAQNYKALKYYRLDGSAKPPDTVLDDVRTHIAAGLPSMFGFTVYSSMPGVGIGTGDIPYPAPGEAWRGGHAVGAVGYDDERKIGSDAGALLIRNSWGVRWGEDGYGWLPYRYVLTGLAVDFWSLVRADYVDTRLFQ